jgi:hypothetical protein
MQLLFDLAEMPKAAFRARISQVGSYLIVTAGKWRKIEGQLEKFPTSSCLFKVSGLEYE